MSSQVIGGFSLNAVHRRTIRGPVNPMDKSTIVSIYPRAIIETKCTIQPGIFEINAGAPDAPAVLVVGSSSWWKELEDNQPLLEIPIGSVVIAKSVCDDYMNGLIGCNMGDCKPGLFWLEGAHTSKEVLEKYKAYVDDAIQKQKNWYMRLCEMADALWATSNGNPRSIDTNMKLAARALNFNEKPWLKDYQLASLQQCPACGNLRNPKFPVCPHCKAIDMKHPDAGGLKFAV